MEVFAHRGSSQVHPENTMAAFRAALIEGATGIETDLRLTRDGVIVLVHDGDLQRIADDPRRVFDLTLTDLETIRIRGKYRVATLDQLWGLAAGRARVNLEVKDSRVTPTLVRFLAVQSVEVLVTSTQLPVIDAVQDALGNVVVGPVLDCLGPPEMARLRSRRYGVVSLRVESFSERALEFCRREKLALLLWVVNEPDQVVNFARLGVDGVFTDCPGPVALALRERGLLGGNCVP
jgi:glycerophosphoryl diester phosphodiesterase